MTRYSGITKLKAFWYFELLWHFSLSPHYNWQPDPGAECAGERVYLWVALVAWVPQNACKAGKEGRKAHKVWVSQLTWQGRMLEFKMFPEYSLSPWPVLLVKLFPPPTVWELQLHYGTTVVSAVHHCLKGHYSMQCSWVFPSLDSKHLE